MKSAKIPHCEQARLEALRRYAGLGTSREPIFDRITKLAASVFETPVALLSLIDRKREWFISCFGVDNPGDVDRKIAFCAHTILSDDVLVVPDTWEDPRFHDNPIVLGASVRFYAGAPLVTPEGFRVGTLCVSDRVPRSFSSEQAAELQDFAAMIMETLEARRATAPLVSAVETTAFGVTICDPHQAGFPIIFANPGFAAITGYNREEILGRSCRFLQGERTDLGLVQDMREALAGRQPFHGTVRNYRKDGTAFWNSLNINPVFDDAGALISYVGVQVDITAQVEALEKACESEARLAQAQQAANLGSWECRFTSEGVLDERSVLWSDETYRLVGLAPGTPVDLWDQFFRTLHPDDAPALNAAWSESLRTLQPYRIDHRLILPDGTVRVVHEEAHVVFDETSGKPLRMVGTMQDITERRAADEALRQSEQDHRTLFDANPLPSWVFDLCTLAFLEVNQAAVTHYGYSRDEFLAMTLLDFYPPEDVAALLAELPAVGSAPSQCDRRHHRKKDGTPIEVEISGAEIAFAGRPARLSVVNDVTERSRTERALRESEKRFSGTFTHSPIGAALLTPDGRWLKANLALCQMVGYSEADLLGRSFQDITHPEDVETGRASIRQINAGEIDVYQTEKRYFHADGRVITVAISSTVVRNDDGTPSHLVAQTQDITARKHAEKALLESRHFLRSILDALPSQIAILDEQGRIVETNQAWRQSAPEDGCMARRAGVGDDYLQCYDAEAGDAPEDISAVANGIRAVLCGEREDFYRECTRQNRSEKQWFSVGVTRFEVDGAWRIVLAHDDITARKQAEVELRWKTAFLEAQIHSSPDAIIVVDHQGRLLLQNQRCVDLWQIPDCLKRVSVHQEPERLQWVINKTTDPDGFAEMLVYVQAHPDETRHTEVALRNGTCLDLRSAPVVGKDGIHYGRIWTYRDITERKRIEESLRESEARFQHIAANVPGMVYRYVRHPNGTIALPFASQGCYELYGLKPEELQNDATKMLSVIHPEDRAGLGQSVSASAVNLSPWNWQGRVVKPDTGEIRYIQGMSRPERHGNGDIVWDGLIVDVTDRKQAEEARRAKEVAERTNQEKSRFLSRMSHELRTPLNAILGFGQVLEFSKLQGQDATALRYILQGGQHLLTLVDEVLDLSRAETGDLRLVLVEVNADAVARECVGLLARLAQVRGITCSVETATCPVRLRCDEQRLRQTLLNLLSNAIKYNREGGRVLVRFQQTSAGRLRLNVVDTGPGIAPEGLARLFVPFERLDYENGEVEGTGLGLVVSRRIAEAMDGTVGVESEVGRGSTFYIELPLAPLQLAAPADPSPVGGPAGGDSPAREGVAVLYIEDNLSNLQVMEMLLARRRPHWRFLSARDGHEGLDQARREPPGLVLLDLQLPGMTGEEVLDELRGHPATASVRVIVLSADATQHSRERLLARGADEYVSKPFQAEALLRLLDCQLAQNGSDHSNKRQDPGIE